METNSEELSLIILMWLSAILLLLFAIILEGRCILIMFYDYHKILSYNAFLNILIGERGVR